MNTQLTDLTFPLEGLKVLRAVVARQEVHERINRGGLWKEKLSRLKGYLLHYDTDLRLVSPPYTQLSIGRL